MVITRGPTPCLSPAPVPPTSSPPPCCGRPAAAPPRPVGITPGPVPCLARVLPPRPLSAARPAPCGSSALARSAHGARDSSPAGAGVGDGTGTAGTHRGVAAGSGAPHDGASRCLRRRESQFRGLPVGPRRPLGGAGLSEQDGAQRTAGGGGVGAHAASLCLNSRSWFKSWCGRS